jgi:hypothetical protein
VNEDIIKDHLFKGAEGTISFKKFEIFVPHKYIITAPFVMARSHLNPMMATAKDTKKIKQGTIVDVVEIIDCPKQQRIRGKLSDGHYISIKNTGDGDKFQLWSEMMETETDLIAFKEGDLLIVNAPITTNSKIKHTCAVGDELMVLKVYPDGWIKVNKWNDPWDEGQPIRPNKFSALEISHCIPEISVKPTEEISVKPTEEISTVYKQVKSVNELSPEEKPALSLNVKVISEEVKCIPEIPIQSREESPRVLEKVKSANEMEPSEEASTVYKQVIPVHEISLEETPTVSEIIYKSGMRIMAIYEPECKFYPATLDIQLDKSTWQVFFDVDTSKPYVVAADNFELFQKWTQENLGFTEIMGDPTVYKQVKAADELTLEETSALSFNEEYQNKQPEEVKKGKQPNLSFTEIMGDLRNDLDAMQERVVKEKSQYIEKYEKKTVKKCFDDDFSTY